MPEAPRRILSPDADRGSGEITPPREGSPRRFTDVQDGEVACANP